MTSAVVAGRGRRQGSWRWIDLALAGLVAAPLGLLVVEALADQWTGRSLWPQTIGTRGFDALFDDPLLLPAVRNSAAVAGASVAIALVVGWPAARAISVSSGRVRTTIVAVVVAPLVVPQLAVGTGLTTWMLRLGLADSLAGVVLAHLVYVLGYVVLALVPAFSPELTSNEEAASTLGAGPLRRFLTVTLPASRGAVLLAVALGFAVSWSQYGTSLGVGGGIPMLPVVAVPYLRSDPQIGAAVTVVLLLPALVLAVLAGRSLTVEVEHRTGGSR